MNHNPIKKSVSINCDWLERGSTHLSWQTYKDKAELCLRQLIDKKCEGKEFTGWFDYPKLVGFKLQQEIEHWKKSFVEAYDCVVVAGIGGSYLGTKAVESALKHEYFVSRSSTSNQQKELPIVYLGQHLSEKSTADLFEYLDTKNPVVNVISKSGTTTETSVAFRFLRNYMEARYKEKANSRILATTDAHKGSLRKLAEEKSYASFIVPNDIGGRFSVFSAVGLLPLYLAGYNTKLFLQGANDLFAELESLSTDVKEENYSQFSLRSTLIKQACLRVAAENQNFSIEAIAYNEPKLGYFVEWYKQLFGESEGKQNRGLFPVGLVYSTDLHSLGQYLQDGKRSILECFLTIRDLSHTQSVPTLKSWKIPEIKNSEDGVSYLAGRSLQSINEAAMKATVSAHAEGKLPVYELEFSIPYNEEGFGYMMAYYMVLCGVSAAMLDVNPYDQPGVELYKKKMFSLLGKKD